MTATLTAVMCQQCGRPTGNIVERNTLQEHYGALCPKCQALPENPQAVPEAVEDVGQPICNNCGAQEDIYLIATGGSVSWNMDNNNGNWYADRGSRDDELEQYVLRCTNCDSADIRNLPEYEWN